MSQLQKRFESKEENERCLKTYHFQIQEIYLEQYEGFQKRKKLTMMVLPTISVPDDWSLTFYEGLNKHPDTIFKDKTVAELGCGNGWISIAIAEKWAPLKVYGLDINPSAVNISWINLYLNALDDNGQLIYDEEKKTTLLDRVEFHESDLLSYCRDNKIELDRILGCIPQILNPNPDAMSKTITEFASEEFLHSLSNYYALQIWSKDQDEPLLSLEKHEQEKNVIEWSPADSNLLVRDCSISTIAFDPDERCVANGENNVVNIFSVKEGKCIRSYHNEQSGGAAGICWSKDGNHLAVGFKSKM